MYSEKSFVGRKDAAPLRAAFLQQVSERDDVVCLRAFIAGHFDELHALPFFQGAMAFTDDRTEMHEQVFTTLALDESVTFTTVEPFNGSGLFY